MNNFFRRTLSTTLCHRHLIITSGRGQRRQPDSVRVVSTVRRHQATITGLIHGTRTLRVHLRRRQVNFRRLKRQRPLNRIRNKFRRRFDGIASYLHAINFGRSPRRVVQNRFAIPKVRATRHRRALTLGNRHPASMKVTTRRVRIRVQLRRQINQLTLRRSTFITVRTNGHQHHNSTLNRRRRHQHRRSVANTRRVGPINTIRLHRRLISLLLPILLRQRTRRSPIRLNFNTYHKRRRHRIEHMVLHNR